MNGFGVLASTVAGKAWHLKMINSIFWGSIVTCLLASLLSCFASSLTFHYTTRICRMTTIPISRNSLSSDDELISRITEIRAINNACWMGLLRLAVKHAPQEAKSILADIQRNDLSISELNGKLAGCK